MTSRDSRNRLRRPGRDSQSSSRDDLSTSAEDIHDHEDDIEFEPVDEYDSSTDPQPDNIHRSGFPSGRSSGREGTADQINRLRESMRRGASRRGQANSRQTIGRKYLSRPDPEPGPVEPTYVDDDDDYDQPPTRQGEVQLDRPASRRRVEMPRDDPYVSSGRVSHEYRGTASYEEDDDDDDPYYDDEDDFTEYDAPRGSRGLRVPSSRGGGGQRQPTGRPTLPAAITQADLVNDAGALSIIGVALLSLAAMAILVANKADSLAPSFATHVSASGVLEDYRSSNHLWRLPLLSAMLTLMNIAAAWFISPLDRFASRFLLAAAVVVQLMAWVAIIRIL